MAKVVRYIGSADRRQILKSEWADAGVKGQDTVVWEDTNGWTVLAEKLSDDALQIIEEDDGLVIVDTDNKGEMTKTDRTRGAEVSVPIVAYGERTGIIGGVGGTTMTGRTAGGPPGGSTATAGSTNGGSTAGT